MLPGLPWVFEVANQFFLLAVYTDDRVAYPQEQLLDSANISELDISVRHRLANTFTIPIERVFRILQQMSNRFMTQGYAFSLQHFPQLT